MHAFSSSAHTFRQSLSMAQDHYENFPVASLLLPKRLRYAIAIIYRIAREADDIADEGDATVESRLEALQQYEDELLLVQAYIQPERPLFRTLQQIVRIHCLDVQLCLDLISAFKQDVVKTRYHDFDEVLDYCRRSANPVGRLMLQLYGEENSQYYIWSDQICTALQLINFYQDIAIDLQKNGPAGRIYLCTDEMRQAGITEQDLRAHRTDSIWQAFFLFNIKRAESLLNAGKPLGQHLDGRFGLEIRMIIAGAERMLFKLKQCRGDVYQHRPALQKMDWPLILLKALFKK